MSKDEALTKGKVGILADKGEGGLPGSNGALKINPGSSSRVLPRKRIIHQENGKQKTWTTEGSGGTAMNQNMVRKGVITDWRYSRSPRNGEK